MKPVNGFINPILTDLYELTMAYAYFNSGKYKNRAIFDLFFRKNPFNGEFTIFAGLSEALKFLKNYSFTDDQIDYVCGAMPACNNDFKDWLRNLDCSGVRVDALPEGTLAFPRIPMMRVEGPLGICQLLESTLLNLVSYSSLIATNAARMRLAAGEDKALIEFGMRRAQGPDGAVSAARYSYLGGFDGTSNVMGGYLYDIPVSGTQAHSYISSYANLDDLHTNKLLDKDGNEKDFVEAVMKYREELGFEDTNEGELASFIAYAQSYPNGFLALVDTYHTLESGIPNFLVVSLALDQFGYDPVGIRLDSGDLSHLSKRTRQMFKDVDEKYNNGFTDLKIVASNEINEETLRSLAEQGHEIDIFGIGTHLVTCQADPSLGCVYKLVQIDDSPRIKLSENVTKMTLPGRKTGYRLYGEKGHPIVDLLILDDEKAPEVDERILCCHPFEEEKRMYVVPSKVERLHEKVWDGDYSVDLPAMDDIRKRVQEQIKSLREDHLRPLNPTPYKVSLSEKLYDFLHELWHKEAPIKEMR